jgi:chaperonin GroES
MEIKPYRDYILCERLEKESQTSSGLIIATGNNAEQKKANVLKVGDGCKETVAGDTVVFKAYAADDIEFEGNDYILIRECDVIAKICK